MFVGIIVLFLVSNWLPVHCLGPVPTIYRKAELALNRYMSHPFHDPVIHSLLNILIHDKHARAFISDQAIDIALATIKQFDQQTNAHSESLFHEIIYGKRCQQNQSNCKLSNEWEPFKPTPDLKAKITSALDKFFASSTVDDFLNMDTNTENKS
jgi:hypothetical protein